MILVGKSVFVLAKNVGIGYNLVGGIMKVKSDYILKKIAGSYVVIPVRSRSVDFSGVIKLTESASVLWRMLETGADREELTARLLEEYNVDEATARTDVDRFIEKLSEADLIE